MNNNKIVIIQKIWKGYIIRKKNKEIKDGIIFKLLLSLVNSYNEYIKQQKEINKFLNKRKIRVANYPSEITENLVKFAINKKYGFMPCWDVKKGDLILLNKQLEVKGSLDLLNGGPSSFGPTEKWHKIYFVDCKDTFKLNFKIYEIKLSNNTNIWNNLKVNKKDTYKKQCNEKRRPRIIFKDLLKQIPNNYINILFEGNIYELE